MNFVPENNHSSPDNVPFFDDVTSDAGWQGQSTTKSLETLKSEVFSSIGRLGGLVTGFRKGQFMSASGKRDGFQLSYVIQSPGGSVIPGRIDIAALPVKNDLRTSRSYDSRREKSMRMALFMLRVALDGTWFLQQLSPGYSALMPWMLADGDKTVSQMWGESSAMKNILPPPEGDFVEGILT